MLRELRDRLGYLSLLKIAAALTSFFALHVHGIGTALGPHVYGSLDSVFVFGIAREVTISFLLACLYIYMIDTFVYPFGRSAAMIMFLARLRRSTELFEVARPVPPWVQAAGIFVAFNFIYFGGLNWRATIYGVLGAALWIGFTALYDWDVRRRKVASQTAEPESEELLKAKDGDRVLAVTTAVAALALLFVYGSGVNKGRAMINGAEPARVVLSGSEVEVKLVARTSDFLILHRNSELFLANVGAVDEILPSKGKS